LKHGLADRRKGAAKTVARKLSEEEKSQVVAVCCSREYRNLTPYEIVPLLAEKDTYLASESTFYRVLREEGLLKARKLASRRTPAEPEEITASSVNEIWSWDITYLKTQMKGRYFYLYLFMDVFSRAIMGWEVHESEDGEQAANLVESLCEKWQAYGVLLRSDNGGPMCCFHMLSTLQRLNVVPSFSRPSVSNDNPFSEALFKTLKYTAGYPGAFETIEEARAWVAQFVDWYNNSHRHSRISYVTPMQRHTGKDESVLAKRRQTYTAAKHAHPDRWPSRTRSWDRPETVCLKRPNHRKAKKTAA
jgi:putative transposase